MRLDVAIVGGGSAGYAAAVRGAQLGLSVALVEAEEVGGTCLHRGCIPTKALLESAAAAQAVRDADGFGVQATLIGVDAGGVVAYQQQVVTRLHRGLVDLLASCGVRVIKGIGRLSSAPLGVHVGDELLEAKHVVLATGATPITLGLPVDGVRVLTSDHALQLHRFPESALIVGGGVIGVEFASAWASLGVDVTVVEAAERLIPTEDPAVSKELASAFARRGIRTLLGAALGDIEVSAEQVRADVGGKSISADVMLVAVGRKANPEAVGATGLQVNPDLTTNITGVYAAGDLAPGPQLAHRGYLQGRYVANHIAHRLGLGKAPTLPADSTFPRVTYSSPQIVSVGHSLAESQALGETEVAEYPLMGSGMALIHAGAKNRTRGFLRLVSRKGAGIVGVQIVGEAVAELAGEAALLVGWEAQAEDLLNLSHAHPSLGEAFFEAALVLAGQPLHMRPARLS